MVNTIITARRMDVTDALRSYTEKKITKLVKFNNRISEIEVIIDGEGLNHKIEIIVKADNHQRFVVNNSAEDAYACIDTAMDKIERQLTRDKEKTRDRKRRTGTAEATAEVIQTSEDEEKNSELLEGES